MAKKIKKQPAKIKPKIATKISKKYLLFFVALIVVAFFTIFQAQNMQTYQQHAATATCGAPGDPGNEDGVGKYCTQGGGQCQGTGSPICSADIETGVPGICSKSCNTDADCGTGAVCFQDTLGKGCEPVACEATPVPTSIVPSSGCLGPGCVPSGSPAPSTAQPGTTGTPTNNGGGSGGGTNLLQLLIQFITQIIQFFVSLFQSI